MEILVEEYRTSTDKGLFSNLTSTVFSILDNEELWVNKKSIEKIDEKFEEERRELLDQSKLVYFVRPS